MPGKKAKKTKPTKEEYSPLEKLMKALSHQKESEDEIITKLENFITLGGEVDSLECGRLTPLYLAAQNGYLKVVTHLVSKGACVNFRVDTECTALHVAAIQNEIAVVNFLLECDGIDINPKTDEGFTPLYIAVQSGNAQIAAALVKIRL